MESIIGDWALGHTCIHFWDFSKISTSSMVFSLKCRLSALRRFLVTESLLKIMKNTFYFIWKAFFNPNIFQFLSRLFGHNGKRLDKKTNVNFKIYDVRLDNK